jgi:glycopeptide antibiotics resistance protein
VVILERSKKYWIPAILYVACILFITIGVRSDYLYREVRLVPLWSIFRASSLRQVFLNVALFIPLGYLLARVCRPRRVVLICFLVSFSVEVVQYITFLGTADVDDLITNTLGGMIGALLYSWLPAKYYKRTVAVMLAVGLAGCIYSAVNIGTPVYSRAFDFQATLNDSTLSGTCRIYEGDTPSYKILLDDDVLVASDTEEFEVKVDGTGELKIRFDGHRAITTGAYVRNKS